MSKHVIHNQRGEDVAEGPRFYRTRSGGTAAAQTPLVGKDGQYNASSKADLRGILSQMTDMLDSGELSRAPVVADTEGSVDRLVEAAMSDRNLKGGAFERLGQVFAEIISETMGRQGFSDKILARVDTQERGIPRVEVDQHDVVSWHMTSAGAVRETVARPRFIFPEAFWLATQLLIDEEDLFYAGQSFLERKYNAALAATMVREDNVTKFLLDQAAPIANDLISFGAFTPTVWATLRDQVWRWALQTPHCLIAVDLQKDIFADADWHGIYSPVEKHVLFTEGKFGEIGGVEVFTDGYRYDTLRVLEDGEIYMLAAPATLGAKLPLVPMYSEPINKHAVDGSPRKGWWLGQYEAIVIANSKGVSKGVKL
ncbi:hypothetical protein LCGC14_0468810 [marine sediment metagenome]|uniref:Uncharacterized protein n=1 Tax=marine sediment metagenome TaxID=412755 RepID=A0A0F9SCT3_9ZZZZ